MIYKTNKNTLDYISAEVVEIEKHLHNYEKWFGVAAVPNGEIHVADRLSGTTAPFQLVAGNNAFGNWVQILGSDDTPVQEGKTKFDLHRCIIVTTNSTNLYVVQIITGETSEFATKLLNEDFDEFPYISASNNNDSGISDVLDRRANSGTKVWMRTACIGGNGNTINLYHGIHEYIL